ncbi:hypothetical protein TNCV_11851 [Trichonephila clavipes]|nr:hypothetical protein TNCV_11851 [Trichonephila clavipes]
MGQCVSSPLAEWLTGTPAIWDLLIREVPEFHLATRRDYLRNHQYVNKVVTSPLGTLWSSGEVMDSTHLVHCSALHKTFLAERYWLARDILDL